MQKWPFPDDNTLMVAIIDPNWHAAVSEPSWYDEEMFLPVSKPVTTLLYPITPYDLQEKALTVYTALYQVTANANQSFPSAAPSH